MTVVGLELLVADLDAATDFFTSVLGFPLAWRGQAADAAGETSVVDGGAIAITLFEPARPSGNGAATVADRTPRLSQILVADMESDQSNLAEIIRGAGLAAQPAGPDRSYVPPAAFEGVVGFPVALTLTNVNDLPESERDAVGLGDS